jgi:hypothetical protein
LNINPALAEVVKGDSELESGNENISRRSRYDYVFYHELKSNGTPLIIQIENASLISL